MQNLLLLLVSFYCKNSIQLFHEKNEKLLKSISINLYLKSIFKSIFYIDKRFLGLLPCSAKIKSHSRRSKEPLVALEGQGADPWSMNVIF